MPLNGGKGYDQSRSMSCYMLYLMIQLQLHHILSCFGLLFAKVWALEGCRLKAGSSQYVQLLYELLGIHN